MTKTAKSVQMTLTSNSQTITFADSPRGVIYRSEYRGRLQTQSTLAASEAAEVIGELKDDGFREA